MAGHGRGAAGEMDRGCQQSKRDRPQVGERILEQKFRANMVKSGARLLLPLRSGCSFSSPSLKDIRAGWNKFTVTLPIQADQVAPILR